MTPKKPQALASSKFETSGRTLPAGTSTLGSLAWSNWSIGMLRRNSLSTEAIVPGTIQIVARYTLIVDAK
jgi:hypothetical protein